MRGKRLVTTLFVQSIFQGSDLERCLGLVAQAGPGGMFRCWRIDTGIVTTQGRFQQGKQGLFRMDFHRSRV